MSLHISLAAEEVMRVWGLSITNSMLTGVLAALVVMVTVIWAARRMPHMLDAISDVLLDMIEQVTHNRAKAIRFFPILISLFLFILINNWFGLLPGVGSITVVTSAGEVPLFRGMTADLNATLALAIISVLVTHIYAVRELGLWRHLGKYFSWNPILLFVGLLELLSDLSKMMSFSFRLFGNIFAGEVLLVVVSYLAPALAPLPFFLLEIFVGFIQGVVFTMLTLVFLEIATSHHGEEAARDEVVVAPETG